MLRDFGLQPGACPTSTCLSWSAAVRTTFCSMAQLLRKG